jgi:uncharacterized protein
MTFFSKSRFMKIQALTNLNLKIPRIIEEISYLELLVLFGSRAKGNHDSTSDWDFALLFDEQQRQKYESGGGWNCYRSMIILQQILELDDNEMDWVDLKDVSELLANEIAKDGIVIYESEPGIFAEFQEKALITPQHRLEIRRSQQEQITASLQRLGF